MLNQLYTNKRTGVEENTIVSRTDFQRDFDRIIFSTSFRRLQNKTQVFPLPGSVFVHNRLTHSLEVASVGRSLGSLVGEFIAQKFDKNLTEESKNFYLYNLNNVVAAACLCHDIGNPAFGHSGEDAIASYFERNDDLKTLMNENQWADLVNFEGIDSSAKWKEQRRNTAHHDYLSKYSEISMRGDCQGQSPSSSEEIWVFPK